MIEIVSLLVRGTGLSTQYLTQRIPLKIGDKCLVESEIGLQIATVVSSPRIVKKRFLDDKVKLLKVIRVASEEDMDKVETLRKLEETAFSFCVKCIKDRGLKMKLTRVIFAFDRSKALFMFTADGRIDFRELVRDLAHRFKTRIEMKQIGVRDEARLLGGIGNCGCPLCCQTFLRNFHPVSVKMAKDQGLSLIPSKISGLCGRLMCCLQYEHAFYSDQLKKLPRIGRQVKTPKGVGYVRNRNVMKSTVLVALRENETFEFPSSEVVEIKKQPRGNGEKSTNSS